MLDRLKPSLLPALLILVAVFGGTGSALYLDDGDPATAPVKVIDFGQLADALVQQEALTVEGQGAQPDLTIPVDPDNQQDAGDKAEAPTDHTPALHEDARDETPPGVSEEALDRGAEKTEDLADEQLVPGREPGGAQSYSCPARHVVNQSSLSASRVGVALHFTVSSPGSLDAIRGLFNTPSFGASSNYGFELYNGRCQQWVPESRKAWAQGAFNSNYVSIEIISNDLSRAQWLATPAFKKGTLAALVRDISTRIGSPKRLVDPVGCTATPGIVDHDRLECGNSHWDVGPGFPWDIFIKQVNQRVNPASPLTKRERRIVHRTSKGTRRSKARACRQNVARRAVLRKASRRNPAADRKRRRGARRTTLHDNYKKRC